jgi:hypothetical protein
MGRRRISPLTKLHGPLYFGAEVTSILSRDFIGARERIETAASILRQPIRARIESRETIPSRPRATRDDTQNSWIATTNKQPIL